MRTYSIGRFALWILLPTLSGCSILFPSHPNSDQRTGERVVLELVPDKPGEDAIQMQAIPTQKIVDVALRLVEKALETEASRYTASYSAKVADVFYADRQNKKPRFKGFTLSRYVDRNPERPASQFQFGIVASPGKDAFTITLDRIELNACKPKVLDTRWRQYWWTRIPFVYGLVLHDVPSLTGMTDYGDAAIDVRIDLSMHATWIDSKSVAQRKEIARVHWELPDVSLDAGGTSMKPKLQTGWLPWIPVSAKGGFGNFELEITVTESDDFGKYLARSAALISENREKLIEKIVVEIEGAKEKDVGSSQREKGAAEDHRDEGEVDSRRGTTPKVF